nr:immunoglobulin light chain junction region [Macaca mulatta]
DYYCQTWDTGIVLF